MNSFEEKMLAQINYLIKQNEEKEKKIDQLKELIIKMNNNSKNEIQGYKKEVEELKNEIKKLKVNSEPNLKSGNSIIKDNSSYSLIFSNIKKRLLKNIKSFNLVYKSSVDGDEASVFHKKCDNLDNIIIIIQTKDSKIFGGFNAVPIRNSSNYIYDDNAFLFSLSQKKVFPIIANYNPYKYDKSVCLCLGSKDLVLANKFLSGNNYEQTGMNQEKDGHESSYFFNNKKYLLNGKKDIDIEEVEVYQVHLG